MEQQIFTNESILSWLQYFAKNTAIDLEKVKMLDITRKNKNLIPTVESHRAVLVFTEAGIADIFTGCGMRDLAIVKSGTMKDLSRQARSNMIK